MEGGIEAMPFRPAIPDPIVRHPEAAQIIAGREKTHTRVATKTLTVPVGRPEPRYTGRFISVELAKPEYVPGERIKVTCKVEVTRTADVDPGWSSEIRAYDVRAARFPERITQVRARHIAVPWRADKETWDDDLDLGPQPEGGLRARLELWAGGSPMYKVAEAPLRVGLLGEPEEARPFPWLIAGVVVIAVIVLYYAAQR